ncbi:MAG: hypothetical protein P1P83_00970 [Bacteroidales bacterium]|nr:hypothetical protein [Bacteroidales bacterium]MDT8372595.1 hypothetical protein [Bacteroidales bacterium]
MKKILLSIALILFTLMLSGQTLQKGQVIGFHVITPELNPDVTFNQWNAFAMDKYLPAFNKEFEGEITLYWLSGERGKYKNSVAFMIVFKSLEVRNKYIPEVSTQSDLFKARLEKVTPILDEWMKMGTYTSEWSDWVIL